jgi:hypothetical protein
VVLLRCHKRRTACSIILCIYLDCPFPRSDRPRSCRKIEHIRKVTGAMVDVDFGEFCHQMFRELILHAVP